MNENENNTYETCEENDIIDNTAADTNNGCTCNFNYNDPNNMDLGDLEKKIAAEKKIYRQRKRAMAAAAAKKHPIKTGLKIVGGILLLGGAGFGAYKAYKHFTATTDSDVEEETTAELSAHYAEIDI